MQHKTLTLRYQEAASPDELTPADRFLIENAFAACNHAYAPYSGFQVGASVQLANGTLVAGNNQENGAYPSGLCAERVALFAASAQNPGIAIEAIAIVASTARFVLSEPVTPCGACRQVMAEYEKLSGKPMRVLMSNGQRAFVVEGVENLLPFVFHGDRLKK